MKTNTHTALSAEREREKKGERGAMQWTSSRVHEERQKYKRKKIKKKKRGTRAIKSRNGHNVPTAVTMTTVSQLSQTHTQHTHTRRIHVIYQCIYLSQRSQARTPFFDWLWFHSISPWQFFDRTSTMMNVSIGVLLQHQTNQISLSLEAATVINDPSKTRSYMN